MFKYKIHYPVYFFDLRFVLIKKFVYFCVMIIEPQDISYVYTGLVLNEAILGLIGGIVAAVGAIVGSVVGSVSQNRTNRKNRQLAEYQYSKDVEMWEKNNEYNSPKSQMERYQQAGLNPNLVYGSPAVSGNATSMPSYDAPEMGAYTDFGDLGASSFFNSYVQGKQQENSDKLTESNYELQKTQAAVNRIEAINKFIESKGKVIDNLEKLRSHDFNKSVEGILRDGLVKANNKTDKEIDLIQSNIDVNHGRMNLMQRQADDFEARLKLYPKQAELLSQQANDFAASAAKKVFETESLRQKLPKELSNMDKLNEKLSEDIASCIIRNDQGKVELNIKKLEEKWRVNFGWSSGFVGDVVNSSGFIISNGLGLY